MKVGDYVRTKYGEICQLKEPKYNGLIYSTDIEIDRYNDRDCNDFGFDNDTIKDIIKSSPNIIDLIEEKDYVNGCPVYCINYDLDKEEDIVESITIILPYQETKDTLYEEDIKSIVTKECFESMEYRL